jgi:hypothetical protein
MKKIFLPAILAVTLFISCKKDTDAPGPKPQEPQPQVFPPPQISSIKQTISNGTVTNYTESFIYDVENRLNEIKLTSPNNINVTKKYTYFGTLVQYRFISGGTVISSQSVDYTLNSGGWAVNFISPDFNRTDIYEYNSKGYITSLNHTLNSSGIGYDIYHYNSHNVLDSICGFSLTGAKKNVQVFTYENDKRNTIGNTNKGLKMLGMDQASPVESKTLFTNASGSLRKELQNIYSYTYDSEGRITTVTNTQTTYSNEVPVQSYIVEKLEYAYKQQ